MDVSANSPNASRLNAKSIAELIAVVAAASLPASLLFDWGYFMGMGLPFLEAPIGLSDHLQTWIIWAPWLLFFYAAIFLHIFMSTANPKQDRNDGADSGEESIVAADMTRSIRRLKFPKNWFKFFMIVMSVLGLLVVGLRALPCVLPVVFLFLIIKINENDVLEKKQSSNLYAIQLGFCITWVTYSIVFFAGFFVGERALTKPETEVFIELKNPGTSPIKNKGYVVRSFDKWLLFENSSGDIRWLSTDAVESIELTNWSNSSGGLLCTFGVMQCISRQEEVRRSRMLK